MKSITRAMMATTTIMQATPPGGGPVVFAFPRAGLNFAVLYFAIGAMLASGAESNAV
jgi:hypothetical protein